jgi:hypothetical protein
MALKRSRVDEYDRAASAVSKCGSNPIDTRRIVGLPPLLAELRA